MLFNYVFFFCNLGNEDIHSVHSDVVNSDDEIQEVTSTSSSISFSSSYPKSRQEALEKEIKIA